MPGRIASEAISSDLDLTSLPPVGGAPTSASSAGDLTPPAPARCAGCETSVDKSLAPDAYHVYTTDDDLIFDAFDDPDFASAHANDFPLVRIVAGMNAPLLLTMHR